MPSSEGAFSRSRTLWERARRVLPAGVSSGFRRLQRPFPLYFREGKGARVTDEDGRPYLDYTLGWGPQLLGHSHPSVVEAVQRQVALAQTFGAQVALEAEVAERMCRMCPGVERVLFQTTGTEAVHMALRLARAFTGRPLVVRFAGHYHGWLDGVLARPNADDPFGPPLPLSQGQSQGALADVLCLPWNDLAIVEAAFQRHAGRIAAVITEPLLANAGGILPRPGFLQSLRALCAREGALLVFDEVITGFRVAPGGAAELFGVTPDLATYGKALSAGFALSAVGGRADVLEQVADGRVFQAGTLNGHPVALAAARATLDEICRDGGAALARVRVLGEKLGEDLMDAFSAEGLPLVRSGVGSVFWTFLASEPLDDAAKVARHDGRRWAAFAERLLDAGVLAMQTGRWYVSTAHTAADIEETLAAVRSTLTSAEW